MADKKEKPLRSVLEEIRDLVKREPHRRIHVSAFPITPKAKWIVTCGLCPTFARDSAAESAQDARDAVRFDHDKRHAEHLSVDAVDYEDHPLHVQTRGRRG